MATHGSFYTTVKIGPKQSRTPEGFLICHDVPVARTGMMIYGPNEVPVEPGPDGIVRIMRDADEVFSERTLASVNGKAVTDNHPDEDVTPENWNELSIGFGTNCRRGEGAMDDLMIADLVITTPEGIEAVESGKREISLGYDADYEQLRPGYGRQYNLIVNHIALVEEGRCGFRCAIKDSKFIQKGTEMKGKSKDRKSKVLDRLMQAFKAKDAAEVERVADEMLEEEETQDNVLAGENGESHIHIHIPSGETKSATADDEPEVITEERKDNDTRTFDNEEYAEYVAKNDAEHAEFREMIADLQRQLAELKGGSQTGDEEITEEVLDEVMEEAPKGVTKDSVRKVRDSAFMQDSFRNTVAMAEILVPGIKIPTFDRALKPADGLKSICRFRRQVLDLAYAQPATRGTLDDLLQGKDLDTKNMSCGAVRTLFNSAAAVRRNENNAGGRTHDTSGKTTQVRTGPLTPADINKRNAERWK